MDQLPEFVSIPNKPESTDGLDELEHLGRLWRDHVAMQKAYNNDMRHYGKSHLDHQGIGFDSEGVPYELKQPPPHIEKNNSKSSNGTDGSGPKSEYDKSLHREEKECQR